MAESQSNLETATAVVIEQRIVSGRLPDAVTIDLILDVLPVNSPPFRGTVRTRLPIDRVAWTRPGAQVQVTFVCEKPETLDLAALNPPHQ